CHPHEDWFPLACVTPFSKFIGAMRGEEIPTLSCHPHCSLGTYMFVDQNKKATPVTQFIDMGSMLQEIEVLARKTEKARFKFFSKISAWSSLRKYFHEEKAPAGLTFNKFLQTLQGMLDKDYGRGDKEKEGFTYKTLMVAGMHFMDAYNYDVERVKRCVIHYGAPDGKLYPFCAYNSGPCYREKIEKEHSIAFEDQIVPVVSGKNGCGGC
ncbi:MAG: radical SAM protein, partial [Acidobacteria bacterium]|nr:radical SAM protein [Acidobacteriota bacterium]